MDLSEQKEAHPEKARRLSNMEKASKDAEIILDLKTHEGIQMLSDELQSRIEAINTELLYNVDMKEDVRRTVLAQRDCWLWFLQKFGTAEQTLKKVEDYISKL